MTQPAQHADQDAGTPPGKAVRPGLAAALGDEPGVLPRQKLHALIAHGRIMADNPIEAGQVQPASLDLRLGDRAYRVRASFLPGRNRRVLEDLGTLAYDVIELGKGAVLEKHGVYVVPLQERVDLRGEVPLSGAANPKSSTGRLDVFTRLITDDSEIFDHVPGGYHGPLYAEISPRSFSVRVRTGSRLNQLRIRRHVSGQEQFQTFKLSDRELRALHDEFPLVDGEVDIRDGLVLRAGLTPWGGRAAIGYRAQQFTDIVDVDKVGACRVEDYWEEVRAQTGKGLILDPHQFYILASKEKMRIPPGYAAEMVPIDPAMGEFRVHYAGFFDPGFGHVENGPPGSHAVLEVRSHEVPFILQDGQVVGRLVFERLTEPPDELYGAAGASHYQGQGLKLSKHFK